MAERGLSIFLEGHDGTGKTEQVNRLRTRLRLAGVAVANFVINEPDSAISDDGEVLVPAAALLRERIKDGTIPRTPWENVLWFTESRRLNQIHAVRPAIARGEWVPRARSWWSTDIYQGRGEGVPLEDIEAITRAEVGEDYVVPDLGVILHVEDHKVREERIGKRGVLEKPDTFESRGIDFQQRVQQGYIDFALEHGVPLVDASGSLDEVEERIWEYVKPLLPTKD